MKFKLLLLTLLAMAGVAPLSAQTDAIQGHCDLGGTKAIVSGLSSSNYNNGIIPGCQVSVFLTGTTTLATIFSNASGATLTNPFTAVQLPSPNAGYWIFWAATGVGYDVKMSGGGGNPACTTAPNCYTTPLTYTDLKVGGGGGGSGVTSFSAGDDPPLFTTNVTNPGTTPNLAFNASNAAANTIFGNFTGAAAKPFFASYTCTGLLTCAFNTGSNTLNLNVPTASALSVTATSPIRVNGGTGPVSSGTANIDCPTCGAPLIQPFVQLPDTTHQYYVLYPTIADCAHDTQPDRISSTCSATGTSASAQIFQAAFPFGFPNAQATINYSGFSLPTGIPAANVTAVYAFGVSSTSGFAMQFTVGQCGGSTIIPSGLTVWPGQQVTTSTGIVGSGISSAVCQIHVSQSSPESGNTLSRFDAVGLIVQYTGTPVANPNYLNIKFPLSLNLADNSLGVDGSFPWGLNGILVSELATVASEYSQMVYVRDGATGTDCTTGGGSSPVLCSWNGSAWTAYGGGGGGSGTVTSVGTGTGLTGGPVTTAGVISCVNGSSSAKGCVQVDGTTITAAGGVISAVGGGSGSVSGQALNVIGKATNATTTGAQSAISDDGTTVTSTEPVAVAVAGGQGGTADLTEGTAATGAAGHDVLYADSTAHCIKQSLNGGSFACLGTGSVSVGFAISSGIVAGPATPIILAPLTGTVSHCYFTTNTSDGATALIFNIKFNGTNIISGTNATVAAGTTAGTVSTFTLTSSSIAITAAQKWEMDITSGTSSWSGIAQCF